MSRVRGRMLIAGAIVGYGISVIRSEDPWLSRERWASPSNLLWAGVGSAVTWREFVIPIYLTKQAAIRTPIVASRAWAFTNFVRVGAPMMHGGRTGIGFGVAAGGTGAGNFVAALGAAYVTGAVVGMGISYAFWGQRGARQAMDFYGGGIFFGTQPNYLGTWADPGYFHIPGNVRIILRGG